MVPSDCHSSRSRGLKRRFWSGTGLCRNLFDCFHCDGDCRADRAFSAIYFSEYSSHHTRTIVKPILEILAGIPTVVYGFFAALTVAPLIRDFGMSIGFTVEARSALARRSGDGNYDHPFCFIPF